MIDMENKHIKFLNPLPTVTRRRRVRFRIMACGSRNSDA
jgi:hypothetical protein